MNIKKKTDTMSCAVRHPTIGKRFVFAGQTNTVSRVKYDLRCCTMNRFACGARNDCLDARRLEGIEDGGLAHIWQGHDSTGQRDRGGRIHFLREIASPEKGRTLPVEFEAKTAVASAIRSEACGRLSTGPSHAFVVPL